MLIIGEGEGCLDEEQSRDAQSVGGWTTSATLSNLNRAAKPSVSASEGLWYPGEVGAGGSECSA